MSSLGHTALGAAMLTVVLFSPPAGSDIVTPRGAYAGAMAPWDKDTFEAKTEVGTLTQDDPVALTEVDLSLDVYPTLVRVEAAFTLLSSATSPIVREVGIPVRPFGGKGISGVPLDDLIVEAGGHLRSQPRPVTTTVCVGHVMNPAPRGPYTVAKPGPHCDGGRPAERHWWVWAVGLPPGRPVTTRVRYLQFVIQRPTYEGEIRSYLVQALGSAAAWGGPIAKVSMEVRLHGVEPELAAESPFAPTREGNTLRWRFEDFEPEPSDFLGFRFTSAVDQLGGRAAHVSYLPQDIDLRLRMQDYLMRFAAAEETPTVDEWISLVTGLEKVLADQERPISRAWAHGTLIALRDWGIESAAEEREPEYELEDDLEVAEAPSPPSTPKREALLGLEGLGALDLAAAAAPVSPPKPPPPPVPDEAARMFAWLTPAPLDAEARAVALVRPVDFQRRGTFYRGRWEGSGAETLSEAADRVHYRRVFLYGGWGSLAVFALIMGFVIHRRRASLVGN